MAIGLIFGSCNPFAPSLERVFIDRNKLLGDRRSINGLFNYFRNTYELRDTLLYGKMLAQDYRFTWFDFSNNNQVFWDRDQEMLSAWKMFRSVKNVNLIWNNYVFADTLRQDTLAEVERYFNLVIVQDDQTIFRGTGSARLLLVRHDKTSEWRIKDWFDKSDF